MEKNYNSEINTLGYPKAALFGFCVALVSYILLAVVKAALASMHGFDKLENEVSGNYIAHELSQTYPGMMTGLPCTEWDAYKNFSDNEQVHCLKANGRKEDLHKYKKNTRGPKKPKVKRKHTNKNSHVSTDKLIARRKK